jgi:hypothetical protein
VLRDAARRAAPQHEAGRERVELHNEIDAAATMLIDLAFAKLIFLARTSRLTPAMPCSFSGIVDRDA